MNILIISYWDNGQQMQLLAEALRKYTDHDALHVNIKSSYLRYDSDVCLHTTSTSDENINFGDETYKAHDFDFFILSELLPPYMSRQIPYNNIIHAIPHMKSSNTIIRTGGSVVRANVNRYAHSQRVLGWAYTGAYHDSTLSSKLVIAPTTNVCPIDKMSEPDPPSDKLRISFAPTRRAKGTREFFNVMGKLEMEYDCIEHVLIARKTWKEAIEMKSTCNCTFDQFMISSYANSAIESMWLQHPVFSRINAWTRLLYPDLPVKNVSNEDDLYNSLKSLVDTCLDHGNFKILQSLGHPGRSFIERHHHPKVVAKQWECLIEHVNQKA